jgi:cation diffusion facilitator family transporter
MTGRAEELRHGSRPLHRTVKLALCSIAVGIAVLGLKYLAYHVTGSVALLSDAMESVVNIAAACAAVIALQISAVPADENHPFGHSKAEYFSSVSEGVLVVLAALAILREAYFSALHPVMITAPFEGIVINAAASVLNGAWSFVLIRKGREWRSPALITDGKHLYFDVLTSVGVLAGVGLVVLTGWNRLDALIAAVVAIYILWSGYSLLRDSVGGLMDAAASEEVLDRIRSTIASHSDGALEAHDLRTRYAGQRTFIEFHLIVPGEMDVSTAHDICDHVEAALKREIPGSVVTIHVEPDHKAKEDGTVVF